MHSVHPTPKFSIITVTYNAEKVLEDTIQSVISQTYHHVEYIIVDGASKDGTLSIIDRYRSRITTVVSEPDKGLYDAMNKAISLASGDYLCFLNAGDCTAFMGVFSPTSSTGKLRLLTKTGTFCICAAFPRPKSWTGRVSNREC